MESKTSKATLHANRVGITVASINNALAFWNGVLGLTTTDIVERSDDLVEKLTGVKDAQVKLAYVKITNTFQVELIEYTSSPTEKGVAIKNKPNLPGTMYLNLQVTDLDGIVEKGKNLGWEMVEQAAVVTFPPGGLVPGSRAVYLSGPNQEMVELVEPVKEVKEDVAIEVVKEDEEESKKSEEDVKGKKKVETILIDDC
ncbi:hypothetical protein BO78DRAFT_415456 [Aspergillus sclerotiicarbonarius CBS 121057]|uniref:VOC domain-containing protein n=1 Tax=Aspergillus sclerotiicarbonarius (strain CBS 121057 / IBT 28362) TaxID=1448318 RepID=A0A319EJB4_ASPSB|nr:hypothetical protein BO78DRAFT_415456 [Aspergillus sclerotiicarbonarius CBS 121057]